MSDERDRVTIPGDLRPKVMAYFGDSSTTVSGAIVGALWYAVERYEAEHDIDPRDDVE